MSVSWTRYTFCVYIYRYNSRIRAAKSWKKNHLSARKLPLLYVDLLKFEVSFFLFHRIILFLLYLSNHLNAFLKFLINIITNSLMEDIRCWCTAARKWAGLEVYTLQVISLCVFLWAEGRLTVVDKLVEIRVIKGVQLLCKLETPNGFVYTMWRCVGVYCGIEIVAGCEDDSRQILMDLLCTPTKRGGI